MPKAYFSRCKKYRYHLSRRWNDGEQCIFVGLNPSTAGSEIDDATTRKCILLAKNWGFSGFELVNLFALRSRDPSALKFATDPVGAHNDRWLKQTLDQGKLIVACWGNGGALLQRELAIRAMHNQLYCLGTTKSGQPKHPLYLPTSTPLRAF